MSYKLASLITASAPQLAMISYLLLVGVYVLYLFIIKDFVWPLIKIKYFELLILFNLYLLKKTLDSNEVLVLTKLLLKLFQIYEQEKKPPVFMERLFPKSNLLNENQLTKYELIIQEKLIPYQKLYQYIQKYNEGSINISELARRMK